MRSAAVGSSIGYLGDALLTCAVCTAEVLTTRLHAGADDRHLAVIAAWRERVDGARERIEHVGRPTDRNFKRLVVGVAAALASLHHLESCKRKAVRDTRMEWALLS